MRISTLLFPLSLFAFAHAQDTTLAGIPLLGEIHARAALPDPYLSSGSSGPITIRVDDTQPGITMHTDGLFGADLAIWNSPDRYAEVKPYLEDAGFNWFRFPDGSLSNDYHWNGKGTYDSTGLWTPQTKEYAAGFLGETKWRGTTKDNYGFRRASHLTDGDSSTIWWGELLAPLDPPWFYLDLGDSAQVDSVVITLGKLSPKAMTLCYWDSTEAPYPGPHQLAKDHWKAIQVIKAPKKGSTVVAHFTAHTARYWSVRFQSTDIPKNGVQIAEVRLFDKGYPVSKNNPNSSEQTKTVAMSTRSGDFARTDWTGIKWDFAAFMDYVINVPKGKAVICVNAATGTPEEAAAWVRYANKLQGYKIHDWQIGNENDGTWEEAGPLSAAQYAAKFIAFSKAMKQVDPSIHIHGPLHSTDEFFVKYDGLFTGRPWMESFLKTVGEAERKDHRQYLDAVDFHTYPYWETKNLTATAMLRATARPGPMVDTLMTWMSHYLEHGDQREIHMSEFSSTVLGSEITLQAAQGAAMAHLFAQFAVRAGNRGHALPWDVYGGMQKGPDGTQGSIRLFNLTPAGAWSSWGKINPSSQYFGLTLAFQYWLREGLRALPVTSADSSLRAFALGNGDTTHLLLINMTDRSLEAQVSRQSSHKSAVQIFEFGSDNFQWSGNDENAFAHPGVGAWSNRMEASDTVSTLVPALGISLINWDDRKHQNAPLELMHQALRQTTLLAGDTLEYWATLRQRDGSITGGTFRSPYGSGELTSMNKRWGGELEGIYLRIAVPKDAKPGSFALTLEVQGSGEQKIAERISFRVRGSYRSTAALEDCDLRDPDIYTYAHGSNTTAVTTEVRPGNPPLGKFLQANFVIEQPKNQSWPNFVGVHFPVNRTLFAHPNAVGVIFDYATQHSSADGYFELLIPSDSIKDYDEYGIRLRNTHGNWMRDTVLWSEVHQEGWGKDGGPLPGNLVKELEYRARGEGRGEIRLDNIYLISDDGTEVKMPQNLRRMR